MGRLVHRFLPSIRALGVVDWREWAPQLVRAPERAPADARQSLNRRRANSPHTTPAERPWRCSTTRHTFNLSTVIGESAAIATQGRDSGLHTGFLGFVFGLFLSATPAPSLWLSSSGVASVVLSDDIASSSQTPAPFQELIFSYINMLWPVEDHAVTTCASYSIFPPSV
jgi:hypothetical protein